VASTQAAILPYQHVRRPRQWGLGESPAPSMPIVDLPGADHSVIRARGRPSAGTFGMTCANGSRRRMAFRQEAFYLIIWALVIDAAIILFNPRLGKALLVLTVVAGVVGALTWWIVVMSGL
jgi:hypothetical protein